MKSYYTLLFVLLMIFFSCESKHEKGWDKDKEVSTKVTSTQNDFIVTISTEQGTMKAILFEDTPIHRENFVKLIKQNFYNGLLFHRVIPSFMIQGGDPLSKEASAGEALGRGEISYNLTQEISEAHYHKKGALAAARKPTQVNPDKNSSGCQFYIVQGKKWTEEEIKNYTVDQKLLYSCFDKLIEKPEYEDIAAQLAMLQQNQDQDGIAELIFSTKEISEKEFEVEIDKPISDQQKHDYQTVGGALPLDGEYTVFGQVIEGLEVIDKIINSKTDNRDRPLIDIKMEIHVEEVSKAEITKKYGYQY